MMRFEKLPDGIDGWVEFLAGIDLPVLQHTFDALADLQRREDSISGHQVTDIVLRDPMMTLKVLQYLHVNRNRSRSADITTIDHAIMMLGLRPFFAHFGVMETMEHRLSTDATGREGAMRVLSRARHASLYAKDWAKYRHDIEVEEVLVAALLHDLAEMLMWCFAPRIACRIEGMLRADPHLRSRDAQRAVLGFDYLDLQLKLAQRWHLPALFHDLMDDQQRTRPRVINVTLAVTLARYSALGWHHPFLPRLYESVARFLHIDLSALALRVNRVTLAAARDWRWYGVLPPAALLPLLPGDADLVVPDSPCAPDATATERSPGPAPRPA